MTTALETLYKRIELAKIVYPVYKLTTQPPVIEDGWVYYPKELVDNTTEETIYIKRIIDNRNLQGDTLGKRRLRLSVEHNVELYKVNIGIYFLADLIKLANKNMWFIDSIGQVFKYKKTTRANLITRRITKVLPSNGLGCIFEVEGLSTRFRTLIQTSTQYYAQLAKVGASYILYGIVKNAEPDTWRKI